MSVTLAGRRWVLKFAMVAVLVLLAAPAAAEANGPCGQDATGNTACRLALPSTSSGLLVTSNESDYYVFSAQAGQEIFMTVTDTEAPSCAYDCGDVQAQLYDANGNSVGDADTGDSQPRNGITIARSVAWTVGLSGTYYVIVQGGLGTNASNNPTQVPYTLQVSAQSSPCGYSFQTATCAVNSPASPTGTLQTDNQADYYAMYVQPATELSVTVTDTEAPSCGYSCGDVQAQLYDANGNSVGAYTGDSQPNNGITVPQTFSYTVQAGGIYYLEVQGGLGTDTNDNPTPVPYTLQVSASPNVSWPPPTTTTTTTPTTTTTTTTPQTPKLLLGAVHHSGHTVRLSVKLAAGVGKMTATATSGRRHEAVHISRDGSSYNLSAHLASGSWTITVRFAGATGWLTGTLHVRVRVR